MTTEQLDINIKNSKNILLVSHINPDGDTLGSMCALYSLIKDNYKKKCDMTAVSKIPSIYNFIPFIGEVKHIEEFDLSREYDLVINLDVAALDRCADAQTLFHKAKSTINIDHHETNIAYADLNIIKSDASATAEVLVEIALNLNWKISLDSAICLYTGIVTFQSYCVNKAKFVNNDKIAYTTVYKKDLEKFNSNGEDFTDGLTEKLRAIKTTEIAFVVKELTPTTSKVSMRSKEKNIANVCSAFGGGGHKLAAGAVIKSNTENAIKMILEEINNQNLC